MVMDTLIEKWFSTRDQKITWGISLAFLILFPIYFANMAAFLPNDAIVGADVEGEWEISFTETIVAGGEATEDLADGEEFDFEFSFDDTSVNLGYVVIWVNHSESDESGLYQDQCDDAQGQMVLDGMEGEAAAGSTLSGSSSNNCPSSYTMVVNLLDGYTGSTYQAEGKRSALLANWTNEDAGQGDYIARITLETNTGSKPGPFDPGPASNNEQGESVTVSWRFVEVVATAKAVVDTSAN